MKIMLQQDFLYLNKDKIVFPEGAKSVVIDCHGYYEGFFVKFDNGLIIDNLKGWCKYPGMVRYTKNDFVSIIAKAEQKKYFLNKIRKFFGLPEKV